MAMSIGIIGGGWLDRAFAQAIVDNGIVPAQLLTLSHRSSRDFLPLANWTRDDRKLVEVSDIVIVSLRPEDLGSVQVTARGKLVISVMAGITLETLVRHFDSHRVIRALLNAAAEYRTSYTPWIASPAVTGDDRTRTRRILEACGTADEVSSEREIDYVTGLTGSGPTFPALLMSAMERDAVGYGSDPRVARRAISTLILEAREQCPEDIVQTLVSYGGTTAAAIETMRGAGFDEAVARGLDAACRKSVSMGMSS
jgi:pyrroline-5-carboxylate reductase